MTPQTIDEIDLLIAAEAATYEEWLKTEIQQSINDRRPNLKHDDVMRELDQRIAAIKARKA